MPNNYTKDNFLMIKKKKKKKVNEEGMHQSHSAHVQDMWEGSLVADFSSAKVEFPSHV